MSIERIDRAWEMHRQAAERFDYFMFGAIGAACAYISQTYQPARLGLTPNTLELASLIALFGGAIAGFLRIEATLGFFHANHNLLGAQEERGIWFTNPPKEPTPDPRTGAIYTPENVAARIVDLTQQIPQIRTQAKTYEARCRKWYHWRNGLVVVGFISVVAAKVWSAYV